ncbi:PIG-L family deacetylase [Tumebacillus sp. DT12]|uniref:PIG-L family deacetylase n=1 Tax=Tumebacillus lacus TaxID=2995335 RepID=A0ABT3X1A2_9BACL|nr:PIG-L family deacetylase [Tumebacillus lacus]MCX7570707.1 PIG-L family deacetylase [Tumebacillus lacus]
MWFRRLLLSALIGSLLLAWQPGLAKAAAFTPGPRTRLLVIVPHPDDESLAGTGLIERTLHAGGQVRLVVMTNGDGFRTAAKRAFGIASPTSDDMYRLGLLRQREELAAAKKIGLTERDILFLGYPDAGLHQLWDTHWDTTRPYRGINGHQQVPYRLAYRRGAPYCGQSVSFDLTRVIGEFRPTDVLYPDPHDVHRDHWSTSAFTQYALAKTKSAPRELTYLVHYPDYPSPRTYHPVKSLAPPARLAHIDGVRWNKQPLTALEQSQKHTSILTHRSQVRVMRDLLTSFVRTNELTAAYSLPQVAPLQGRGTQVFLQRSPLPHMIVCDPAHDQTAAQSSNADLQKIGAARDADRLWLCLEFGGSVRLGYDYALHLRLPDSTRSRLDLYVESGRIRTMLPLLQGEQPDLQCFGNRLLLSIPRSALSDAQTVLLSAEVRAHGLLADKTPWRRVRL